LKLFFKLFISYGNQQKPRDQKKKRCDEMRQPTGKQDSRRLLIAFIALAALLLFSSFSSYQVTAAPQGASITGSPSVDSGPTKVASVRNDSGGRIVTITFALEQQDYAWKAYVGNVSGTFVLQNSNNKSIYEWPSIATATGELYISRNGSLNFSSVACANQGNMSSEQTFLGMGASDSDNINNTFNVTLHRGFIVGTNPIANNTCPSIATWVNDTVQAPSQTAIFQETILSDGINIIYASLLNDNQRGFDNASLFDFQAIIPENRSSSTGTNYYFYLELGS
jgi:hypothetical protein